MLLSVASSIRLMMKKIFIHSILVTGALLLFLVWRCLHALHSGMTNPARTSADFLEYYNLLIKATPAASVLLLFLSNLIYLKTKKAFGFVATGIFFTVFTVLSHFYLAEKHFHFTKVTGLWAGGFQASGIIGLMLILTAAVVIFINFLVIRFFGANRIVR